MPKQAVQVKDRRTGKVARIDAMGAVFEPVPGKVMAPAWFFGPRDREGNHIATEADAMYTCPVSGIPEWVFELLHLWWACRQVGALPEAGGFLDQPLMVQVAFPLWQSMDRRHFGTGGMDAGVVAMGVLRAMFGGGKQ